MSHIVGTATGFRDFVNVLDAFLSGHGHAWGVLYSGVGNGRLIDYIGGPNSIPETFTITFSNATDYDVIGSVSGSIGSGSIGAPFASYWLNFDVIDGSVPFQAGDEFTLSTSPAWITRRKNLISAITVSGGATGGNSFHWANDGVLSGLGDWQPGAAAFTYEVEFPIARTVRQYGITTAGTTSNRPTAWTFEYWNGSSWTSLDSRTGQALTAGVQGVYVIASPVSATRYRWNVSASASATVRIAEFALFEVGGTHSILDEAVIWESPGNDGEGGAIVGVKLLWRADQDYWTLEQFAADSYSAAEIRSLPNLQRNLYVPLWNNPMDYWICATGRCVWGAVKIGSQYELFTMGMSLDSYFAPDELAYQAVLGGSLVRDTFTAYGGPVNSTELRYSKANAFHLAFVHGVSSANATHQMPLRYRTAAGQWVGAWCAPYTGETGTQASPTNDDKPLVVALSLEDGVPVVLPIVAFTQRNPVGGSIPREILGELTGWRFVSGEGVAAETVLPHPSRPIDMIVFPDIFRVGQADFVAMELG